MVAPTICGYSWERANLVRTTQVYAISNHGSLYGTSGSECHFNSEFSGGNFINRIFHKRLYPAPTCFQIVDVNHVKNFLCFLPRLLHLLPPGRSYSNLPPREGHTPSSTPEVPTLPSTPGRLYSTLHPGKVPLYPPLSKKKKLYS